MTTIVVVDDEVNILKSMQRSLRGENWELLIFSDPHEALEQLQSKPVDLVISDYMMPVMDGVSFLNRVKAMQPDAMRLILSGQADLEGVLNAINRAEVYRFVTKPWDDHDLKIVIRQALEVGHLQQENKRLAQLVREQGAQIEKQLSELKRLEQMSPGITQVEWDEDGSIDLSSEYEDDDDR